jgi:hypothetical protein
MRRSNVARGAAPEADIIKISQLGNYELDLMKS